MAAPDVMRCGVRRMRAKHHHAELRAAGRAGGLPPQLQRQGQADCYTAYW